MCADQIKIFRVYCNSSNKFGSYYIILLLYYLKKLTKSHDRNKTKTKFYTVIISSDGEILFHKSNRNLADKFTITCTFLRNIFAEVFFAELFLKYF